MTAPRVTNNPEVVSEATINRLSLVLTAPCRFGGRGPLSLQNSYQIVCISLQRRFGGGLACFGQSGKRGIGYEIYNLRIAINEILGFDV